MLKQVLVNQIPTGQVLFLQRVMLMDPGEIYPDEYHLYHDEETFCHQGNSFTDSLPTLCGSGSTRDMQISRNVKFSPAHRIGTSHPRKRVYTQRDRFQEGTGFDEVCEAPG